MAIQTVQITFFSGTGGTKRIAEQFKQECIRRDLMIVMNDLDRSVLSRDHCQPQPAGIDLSLLIFPLHAFDAPEPVYYWIQREPLNSRKVAVISVSGGGEAWPNTGCRSNCCREIEEKGGRVIYERMMCMPSNWTVATPDQIAMHLLRVIPHKVGLILNEILAGKIRRTNQELSPLRAYVSRLEKEHAHQFPQEIRVTENCTGCRLCAKNCPADNIKIIDHRPHFSDSCLMCFRCIYICPVHALETGNFMVLKQGYNLHTLEERMKGETLEPVEKCAAGFLWGALRKYLLDQEV